MGRCCSKLDMQGKASIYLNGYNRIHIIDEGAPGSGHQSSVIKLIDKLSTMITQDSDVTIHLSYNQVKGYYYFNKLRRQEDWSSINGDESFCLFHQGQPWNVPDYRGLTIFCRPMIKSTPFYTQQNVDLNSLTQNEWNMMWDKSKTSWAGGRKQIAFPLKKFLRENAPRDPAYTDPVNYPELGNDGGRTRTLTIFAANDRGHDSFNNLLVPHIKRSIGEKGEPTIMVCQPFLWPSQNNKVRLQHGIFTSSSIDPNEVTAYPWSPLQNANANFFNKDLITVYYSQQFEPSYPKVLETLVNSIRSFQEQQNDQRQFIIAFLDVSDSTSIGNQIDDLNENVHDEEKQVEIKEDIDEVNADARIGINVLCLERISPADMQQYQRESKLFVTEGANTWQELLTLGKPTLSIQPDGETKPWVQDVGTHDGKQMIQDYSKALEEGRPITEFLEKCCTNDVVVSSYFNTWRRHMADPNVDQVVRLLAAAYNDEKERGTRRRKVNSI